MLAVGFFVALFVAFVRAARACHAIAGAGTLAATYLLAMDNANGMAWRQADGHAFEGFIMLVLGPCGALGRARGWLPTGELFISHPAIAHVVAVVVLVGVVLFVRRQSAQLRPEIPRARALDGIALPLVCVIVVETSVLLLGALVAR